MAVTEQRTTSAQGPEPRPAPGALPRRVATPAQASAIASPIRLRILRLTYHDPLTNKEIAERLGRDPATTLHHVRKLVDAGLLEPMAPRRGSRGSREKPYRSTGLSWALDVAPGEDETALGRAMLEAYLGEVADAGIEHVQQQRLALRVDPERLEELRVRMRDLLMEFAELDPLPGRPLTGVYVSTYPSDTGKPGAGRVTMEGI